MKSDKFTESSEIMKDVFTRLTDWEKVRDNKLSSWLKVIINNDNNMKICCKKVNYIYEREN